MGAILNHRRNYASEYKKIEEVGLRDDVVVNVFGRACASRSHLLLKENNCEGVNQTCASEKFGSSPCAGEEFLHFFVRV